MCWEGSLFSLLCAAHAQLSCLTLVSASCGQALSSWKGLWERRQAAWSTVQPTAEESQLPSMAGPGKCLLLGIPIV